MGVIEQLGAFRWTVESDDDEHPQHRNLLVDVIEQMQIPPDNPLGEAKVLGFVSRRIVVPMTTAEASRLGMALQGLTPPPEIQTVRALPRRNGAG